MVIGKSKSNDKLYTKTPELKLDSKKIEMHANQRGTLRMVLKSVRDEKDIETNVYRNLFFFNRNEQIMRLKNRKCRIAKYFIK